MYCAEKPLVMIAAGGTGGHVFPGLAVAQRMRDRDINVVWLGSVAGMELDLVAGAGFEVESICVEGLRRRGLLTWLLAPWRLSLAILQVLRILLRHKPKALIGFGGFVSGPGGLIAAALGIQLLIHEQNAVAGLTNKLLAPLSNWVLLGFPNTIKRANARYVGNPVREEFFTLAEPEERMRGRKGALRLLVVGGSRGAAIFNQVVPEGLAELPAEYRPEVRQQTGVGNIEVARASATRARVEISFFEFIDDIAQMYAWADLVLCRAGASSVAELTAAGVAAMLVPYPSAVDDHQTANAQFLVSRGAAQLIEQRSFTPRRFADAIKHFTGARGELLRLAEKARALAQPDAGVKIADLCVQTIRDNDGMR